MIQKMTLLIIMLFCISSGYLSGIWFDVDKFLTRRD